MSVRLMAAAWALDIASTDKLVLLALADWSNDDGVCWPSIAQLCIKSGLSERAVRQCIGRLRDAGHLVRDEVSGKGVTYTVRPGCTAETPARRAPGRSCPRQDMPPAPDAETPARRAPNTPVNTNTSQKASPSSRARAKPKLAWPLPEGVDRQHWADFLANRKSKRLGFTPTAHRGQLRALADLADDEWPPGRLVEHAAERGWGAIHDPRTTGNHRNVRHLDEHPHRRGLGRTAAAALDVFGDLDGGPTADGDEAPRRIGTGGG